MKSILLKGKSLTGTYNFCFTKYTFALKNLLMNRICLKIMFDDELCGQNTFLPFNVSLCTCRILPLDCVSLVSREQIFLKVADFYLLNILMKFFLIFHKFRFLKKERIKYVSGCVSVWQAITFPCTTMIYQVALSLDAVKIVLVNLQIKLEVISSFISFML